MAYMYIVHRQKKTIPPFICPVNALQLVFKF